MGSVFWLIIWRHHPISRANIVARSIFGFYAKIRVFRALDKVSGVFGSKVIPKLFQICQEFPRTFRGFPILIFYHISITHQQEMLKSPSNPLKPRIIPRMPSNLARFRAVDSARFTHSHGPLTSRIIYWNLSKHVKTTCGFVNIA